MKIEVPCNYYPFQLDVYIETTKPCKIRIIANDPNKPRTRYVDRISKLSGKRKYEIKIPVSPKKINVTIYNVANGNLPFGYDDSFKIVDIKVNNVKEYDVWWNSETKSFYDFAVEFSKNASILSAGNREPHIYRSNDGKFTIDYYNVILDKQTNKMLSTPARIGHNSGVIEVSKDKFLDYTVPMRLVILLHEYAHKYLNPKINRDISYETGADVQGLYVYLGKGWSPYEANKSFLHVFRKANGESNHKRYKILKDFIDKYDKGEVAEIKRK